MSKRIYSMLFIVFVPRLVCAQSASMRLGNLLQNISSMHASFVQLVINDNKVVQTIKGTMALKRPGKFYWQILSPYKQTIIADGKYSWIYDVDLQQVTKHKIDYTQANSPAMLLSGSIMTLQKSFVVSFSDGSFHLLPKGKDAMFQSVSLHFDSANRLDQLAMTDKLGQKSEVKFANVKLNSPIAKSLFVFKAKDNVDVVTN